MKYYHILYIGVCLLAIRCAEKPAGDMIVLGGTIYTVDEKQPIAECVVVKDGKVLYAGEEKEGRKYVSAETQIVDLQGKTMTPGFIEGHGHLMGVGYAELRLDLTTVSSYEELVEKVRDAARTAKPGEWIVGRGWHQDKWDHKPKDMVKGFQTHHLLSAASPDNPVFLSHASGHAAMANARAMTIAGVNTLAVEQGSGVNNDDRGEIIRDELGNPTGIFNENAVGIISRHVPDDRDRSAEALKRGLAACLRNGITSFQDAGASQRSIDLFKQIRDQGDLNVRLYVMLAGAKLARTWFASGPLIDPDHYLTIRSIKLSSDGALGSRGAWLLEPYTDRPDSYGMATTSMDTVLAISRAALQHGFQVCTHAIGDRANREVLDRYQTAFKENPAVTDHRFRIEHAQHLHPSDIPRFAELGVIPSMQGIHMSSDRPWAIDRLGEKRIVEGAYVWQSLLKSGARIVNGTDAPVEPLNPIPSFYASVSRKTLKGTPEDGFEPEQKMTRAQALRSYTLDAAYGAFQEDVLGSIEPGKYADFTIFSKDIMRVSEPEILETDVAMTIVGGKVLFEKK